MPVAEISIDAGFPGGNIVVDGTAEDGAVLLRPDLRDTDGDWFYWSLRATARRPGTAVFRFDKPSRLDLRGPCCSEDGGRTWHWLGSTGPEMQEWSWDFAEADQSVRFAFSFPYVQENLEGFLACRLGHSPLRREVLCASRSGRDVELLRIPAERAPHVAFFTCRHHACESVANYVLEGVLDTWLSDNEPGAWLRANVDLFAVPFVDKDGVEEGDQGKNRTPYDHNRDYEDFIYPETAAIRDLTQGQADRLTVALDLHCPYSKNHRVELIGGPGEVAQAQLDEFAAILASVHECPLPFTAAHTVPFGTSWNTGASIGRSFSNWMRAMPRIAVANALETPYADAEGVEITPQSARLLGRDLAAAVAAKLQG